MTETSEFERHDAYTTSDGEYTLRTTLFESRVTAAEIDGELRYTLTVRAPSLDSAVEEEEVGPNLLDGWFETLERRLADAPGAVRGEIELDALSVRSEDGEAVITLSFRFEDTDRAPDIAKAMAEYVEGTYAEGIVPGYTYRPPVSELLDRARQGEDERSGPMPL